MYAEIALTASPKAKQSDFLTLNFNRKNKYKIHKSLQRRRAQFKYLPHATSKDLLHYINRTLEDHSFDVAIIHIGVNYVINNINYPDFDHVLKIPKHIVQKCRRCSIENIFIPGLLPTTRITEDSKDFIRKRNKLIKDFL